MARKRHSPEQVINKLREAEAARRIGVTDPIRSDNGPEFTARAVSEWLGRVGARTLCMSLDRRGRTACEF